MCFGFMWIMPPSSTILFPGVCLLKHFVNQVLHLSVMKMIFGLLQGARPGAFPDDNSQKRGTGIFFFFVCVLKMKLEIMPNHKFICWCPFIFVIILHGPYPDAGRDNDWPCPKCGNINFSFRTVCNMRKCGTPRPGSQVWATSYFYFISRG